MKILIVDDEMIIRQWFAMTIEKIGKDYMVVGEASNGEEALKRYHQSPADLVVTDIKMPVMDGLEMMKELKAEYPSVKILVLSSYNDFQFAVEAMKYGASDYILKPEVTIEQLKQILQKIKKEVELEKKHIFEESRMKVIFNENRYALREIYINELMEGNRTAILEFDSKTKQLDLQLSRKNITVMAFAPEQHITHGTKSMDKQLLEFSVVNITDEIFKNQVENGCCIKYKDNTFVALFNLKENSIKTYREILMLLFHNLANSLKKFLGIDISAGVSTGYGDIENVGKKYEEALEVLNLKLFYGGGSLELYTEYHKKIGSYDDENNSEKLIQVSNILDNNQYDNVIQMVETYINGIGAEKYLEVSKVKKITLEIAYLFINKMRKVGANDGEIGDIWGQPHLVIQEITGFSDIRNWILANANTSITLIRKKNIKYYEPVENACNYIQTHFSEDISLEKVSEYVHLNRSYFCELFKKETGMGYNEYITKVRIEKAKKLLSNSNRTVMQIAESVGYSNSGYFTRVFKRITGKTPVEYKG